MSDESSWYTTNTTDYTSLLTHLLTIGITLSKQPQNAPYQLLQEVERLFEKKVELLIYDKRKNLISKGSSRDTIELAVEYEQRRYGLLKVRYDTHTITPFNAFGHCPIACTDLRLDALHVGNGSSLSEKA